MSESQTCEVCGCRFWGSPCPLCNVKVGPDGITRAQLIARVESLAERCNQMVERLNTQATTIGALESLTESLLDRINQLVEFHGIEPIAAKQ